MRGTTIRNYVAMGLLGFGSGLPLLMISTTLAIYLREHGMTLTAIGLYSYVLTPHAVKFLWAPILDSYRVPGLGALLGLRRAASAGTSAPGFRVCGADASPATTALVRSAPPPGSSPARPAG